MAIRLHTAVGDEIRRVAQTDPEQAAEMRMSPEYANEVMGRYDEEFDPRDDPEYEARCDEADAREEERLAELEGEEDGDSEPDPREDFGWDGGREE